MSESGQTSGKHAIKTAQVRAGGLIPPADEAALSWFFGKGTTVFERSTFGAMIEQLDREAHTSRSCFACKGTGIAGSDGGEQWTEELDEGRKKIVWGNGNWCHKCRGIGCVPVRKGASSEAVSVNVDDSAGHSGGYLPNDEALTRFAVMSRRVSLMPRTAAIIFAAYFGDAGARWAPTGNGRLFALYPLTEAGQKLLKSVQSEGDLDLPPHERLGVLVELDRLQPKGNRRALLNAAASQALELLEAASMSWAQAQVGQ